MMCLPICLYELLGDSSRKMGTKEAFDKGCGANVLFIDIGKRESVLIDDIKLNQNMCVFE